MDNVVVCTLGKGRVDVTEGLQTVFSHTGGERHGVPLGNAYIEGATRHLLHHDIHRTACRHRWRDTDDTRILLRQFQQRMPEDILVFLRFVGITVNNTLTGLRVELAGSMPCGDIALGRCIAVPFLGVQMQQLRTFHVLYLLQYSHQLFDVVAVKGTEVADVHAVEDVLLVGNGALDGIRQSLDAVLAVIVQQTLVVQPA